MKFGPVAIADALHRGLSVDPDDRFASMDELLEALAPRAVAPAPTTNRLTLVAVAAVALIAGWGATRGLSIASGCRGP